MWGIAGITCATYQNCANITAAGACSGANLHPITHKKRADGEYWYHPKENALAPRFMECWTACKHKAGICGACGSQDGFFEGACCMLDSEGKHAESDPDECKAVPTQYFPAKGHHVCVLWDGNGLA